MTKKKYIPIVYKGGDQITLQESRQWVLDNRNHGCICPDCGQEAKVYPRKMYSSLGYRLINLYRQGGTSEYIHIPRSVDRNGSLCKAKLWGLITMDKRGWWRVTKLGEMFVKKQIRVGKTVVTYNTILGIDRTEKVDIIDVLGKKFDYDELMSAPIPPV